MIYSCFFNPWASCNFTTPISSFGVWFWILFASAAHEPVLAVAVRCGAAGAFNQGLCTSAPSHVDATDPSGFEPGGTAHRMPRMGKTFGTILLPCDASILDIIYITQLYSILFNSFIFHNR